MRIRVLDSHTGGEPTRLVTGGFPLFTGASVREQMEHFRTNHDQLRNGLILEPRGYPAIVGALLCPPKDARNDAGVVFFNNYDYLNMCGHGTIGLVKSLEYMNRIEKGLVRIETIAGNIEATLHENGEVSFENVVSFRTHKDFEVEVPARGIVKGDIAWGGNWFFLIKEHSLSVSIDNLSNLSAFAQDVMDALENQGITGDDGGRIDHIEIFADSHKYDSKNFVLCPGGEYDRSPCGTGTSAKVACLAADGELAPEEIWSQESICGSVFEASYTLTENGVIPRIQGTASITAESELIFDEDDPLRFGIK